MPEKARALTIWSFVKERRWHGEPISENSHDLHDPVKLTNVFGYGYCDDAAAVMTNLSIEAGLKARVWGLNGHVVSEIFYDEKWHMFDADQNIVYRDSSHNVLDLEFLSLNPDFITQYSEEPIMMSKKKYAEIICSIEDNKITEWYSNKASKHSMFFLLNPDDEVQFYFKKEEAFNTTYEGIYKTEGRLFRELKHGNNTHFDNGQLIYSENFAYAIDSIIIKFKNGNDFNMLPMKVSYAVDNENWVEIGEINDSSKTIYFEPYNATGEKFTFNYFIRFLPSNSTDTSDELTPLISNISIENRFVFSYLSLIEVKEKRLKLMVENINGRKRDIKFDVLLKE